MMAYNIVKICSIVLASFALWPSSVFARDYPTCNYTGTNDPCFATWVTDNGTYYEGITIKGLLNGRGGAVYPDGSFYFGDFKDGRRHGLGVWSFDEVEGWQGHWSIGVQISDVIRGSNLVTYKHGRFWYGNRDGGTASRETVTADDFSQWKDAFYAYAAPQRRYIQTVLKGFHLRPDSPLYDGAIDGQWGAKTFKALAIYAALKGEDFFRLQNATSAERTIKSIFSSNFKNFPYGYTVRKIDTANQPPQTCQHDPTTIRYHCYGSHKFENGDFYLGSWKEGQPNGEGSLTLQNGVTIVGKFQNGNPTGRVSIKDQNSEVLYEGDWSDFLAGLEDNNTEGSAKTPKEIASGTGSGFLVSSDGYIVSNHHVIEGCQVLKGEVGNDTFELTIVASDPANDLSLLRASVSGLQPMAISAEGPTVLSDVVVAGYPFGKHISSLPKFTKGVVSSLTGLGNNYSIFQIDAALQPGNSGGPVLSATGEVVGVAVYKLNAAAMVESFGSLPENMNFAIKSSVLASFLQAHRVPYRTNSRQKLDPDKISQSLVFIQCNGE